MTYGNQDAFLCIKHTLLLSLCIATFRTQAPQKPLHLLWQKHFLLIEVRILHKLRAPACIMLAIATLLTHKIYIAIATIYTHITYCRPHHLDGHSSKISQMSLQVDTINILATGVDCVPKSENAEKRLAGVYEHAPLLCEAELGLGVCSCCVVCF